MPLLSRTMIKLGMIHLVLAMSIGVLMVAQPILGLPLWLGTLRPVYLHMITIGWLTQLIFGVAYWMFPKHSREKPRGNERLGWAGMVLLNIGAIFRAIGEPLAVFHPNTGWILVISAVCLLLSGWGFILNTWTRVRER